MRSKLLCCIISAMKKFLSKQMRCAAKIHHLMSLLEKHADTFLMEELSLSFMQTLILNIIRHHPNTTQNFVAECTKFTPGAVSRQIEVLREKGMLTRKVKKDNRREHEITLTAKGKKEVEKAFNLLETRLQGVFTVLNDKECTQMEECVSRLIYKIDPTYYKFEQDL